MNRKEWIEYFEAINNRKPTIQECQQALLNGEFVMEGKPTSFSNHGNSVALGTNAFTKSNEWSNGQPSLFTANGLC